MEIMESQWRGLKMGFCRKLWNVCGTSATVKIWLDEGFTQVQICPHPLTPKKVSLQIYTDLKHGPESWEKLWNLLSITGGLDTFPSLWPRSKSRGSVGEPVSSLVAMLQFLAIKIQKHLPPARIIPLQTGYTTQAQPVAYSDTVYSQIPDSETTNWPVQVCCTNNITIFTLIG